MNGFNIVLQVCISLGMCHPVAEPANTMHWTVFGMVCADPPYTDRNSCNHGMEEVSEDHYPTLEECTAAISRLTKRKYPGYVIVAPHCESVFKSQCMALGTCG